MYRSRLSLSLLLAVVAASGCSEPMPVAPDAVEDDAFVPLVSAPALTSEALATVETVVDEPDTRGPALAPWDLRSQPPRPRQQIFNAGTRVGFGAGFASSIGDHEYVGNVGFVSTTATVTHNDRHLGSQTAKRQRYVPFLMDFGRVKHIEATAKVFADHECGLTVQGQSEHRAWWQFYQGTGVAEWGTELETSRASPYSQGACSSSGEGTGSQSRSGGAGILCTYLITYDIATGEILRAELLFCSSKGGGGDDLL